MNRLNLLLTIFALLQIIPIYAQEFGGNPPGIKWRQIDTDTVRVVFPVTLESEAQRVANTVHYLNKESRRSIGDLHKKIDIVLQNQSVFSNGYVGLAPFRSELYVNAPQDNFSLGGNWMELLAIHEYRHALQFMNTRQGITKAGYVLTGEFGWSYLSRLSIPNWFWEGDAVVSETALTAQGRGRIPAFYNGYKGLVFDKKIYNYQKARNGSLKDLVPNHYELGFLLCNYGREKYENDFWKDVIRDASRYRGLFYPFSKGIKRKTGLPVKQFYEEAFDYYNRNWDNHEIEESGLFSINDSNTKKTITSYRYPQLMENGNVIAHRVGYDKIGTFIQIDENGKEHTIVKQGRAIDAYFFYQNGLLTWAEIGQDPRWSWKTYSNIITYDLKTRKRKKLSSSQKYYSPHLSSDASKIVVFKITPEQKNTLVILSAKDGEVLHELPNANGYYFSYPRWSVNEDYLLAIARDTSGRQSIVKVSGFNGEITTLVPFTNHQLGIPWETDEYIFYSASYSGIDNIFAFQKESRKIYQVSNGKLGAYQASINPEENKVYFSEFSLLGYDIKSLEMDKGSWKEFSVEEPAKMDQYAFTSVGKEGGDISDKIGQNVYPTKKYALSNKLINIHSWSFYFTDPNYEWALRSNNILNTLSMDLGVRYNRNDQDFTYFLDAAYAQYFPVFSFSASIGQRKTAAAVEDEQGNIIRYEAIRWWESIIRPGISIPFDLSSGLYSRSVSLGGFYSYTNVNFDAASEELSPQIQDFDYQSYTGAISFLNRRKKARQNIFSKYSQYLAISYDKSIDEEPVSQLFVDSELSFPGFFSNHNLVIDASYQKEDPDKFPRFGDNFRYARGYNRPIYDEIIKVGTNYHFPVFYPDWGFWGIIYLYRLRTNLFYDYSRAVYTAPESTRQSVQLYNSLGAEFVLDTRVLNMYDFTFGFRYSYLLNEDQFESDLTHAFELFIPLIRF